MSDSIIETLTAVIKADISQLQNGLRAASDEMKDLGGKLTTGLTLPIVAFGAAALKSFSDSETELAQLNATLKSTKGVAGVTAKAATDLASALQKTTRYSDEAVLGAENLLLTFTNIHRNTFPDVTKATLDMATAMHMDLQSAALAVGKAMQFPEEGVTALQRQGVRLTDSQKKLVAAMVKTGNIAGAQKIILRELQTEFGGSAEAAGNTFAGSLDKLKNKFDDLLETIGGKLAPTIEKGIGFLSGLIDKIGALPPGVLELGLAIGAIVAAAGPALSILGTLGSIAAVILSPIGILVAGIATLVALLTNFGGIRDRVVGALQALGKVFGDFVSQVAWPAIKGEFEKIGQGISDWFTSGAAAKFIEGIGNAFIALVTWIHDHGWETLQGAVTSLFHSMEVFFSNVGAAHLIEGIGNAFIGIVKWISTTGLPMIGKAFQQIIDFVVQKFSQIATGIVNAVVKGVGDAVKAVTGGNAGGGTLEDAFNLGGSQSRHSTSGGGGRSGSFTGFATGGYTGDGAGVKGVVHGGEYVVPQGGALVAGGGGYRGPAMLQVIVKGEHLQDEVYLNIAELLAKAS